MGVRAPVGMASDALWRAPVVGVDAAEADRPRALFEHCLRIQDAATLEFCRGYGPHVSQVLSSAMRGAFPVNTSCQIAAESRIQPSPFQETGERVVVDATNCHRGTARAN